MPALPVGRFPGRTLFAVLVLWALPLTPAPARSATEILPYPPFSRIAPVVLGSSSGQPIPQPGTADRPRADGYVVDVRDVNNTPGRATVRLDFSASNLRLYGEQESGTTVDCAARVLSQVEPSGEAIFHPRFGGATAGTDHVEVSANGVVLGWVPARSTDMDALGGDTGLGDFTIFAPLFLAPTSAHPEADFDASGGPIGLGDFTIFAREYLSGVQGSYCP